MDTNDNERHLLFMKRLRAKWLEIEKEKKQKK